MRSDSTLPPTPPAGTAGTRAALLDRDPSRQVDEGLGRAGRALLEFVDFFAIEAQTGVAELHVTSVLGDGRA